MFEELINKRVKIVYFDGIDVIKKAVYLSSEDGFVKLREITTDRYFFVKTQAIVKIEEISNE